MGEVGDQGKEFHQEIGEYAQRKGIDYLYATGELSTYAVEGFNTSSQDQVIDQGVHFAEQKSLLKQLKSNLQDLEKNMNASIAVLVKGSRFTKMERIVQALLKEESLCF
jgi:UDP-N-acetylmuramoyl-tripeptide--D-alanyl-D-alanine ligase